VLQSQYDRRDASSYGPTAWGTSDVGSGSHSIRYEEARRRQHGLEDGRHQLVGAPPRGREPAGEGREAADLVVGQRPPPGARAEGSHDAREARRVRRGRADEDARARAEVRERRFGEGLGGVEVLLVAGVVHREGVAVVVELALLVGLERVLRARLEAEQIVDRVVVLAVVEPVDDGPSRVEPRDGSRADLEAARSGAAVARAGSAGGRSSRIARGARGTGGAEGPSQRRPGASREHQRQRAAESRGGRRTGHQTLSIGRGPNDEPIRGVAPVHRTVRPCLAQTGAELETFGRRD